MIFARLRSWVSGPAGRPGRGRHARRRPHAERLEDRCVLSTVVALTTANELLTFDSATPDRILRTARVTGLRVGESLLGIDYRPATGDLYGVTRQALYIIDPATGAATRAADLSRINPSGQEFGVDFNPVPDRLRLVSDTDVNLRVNPDTGAVLVDTRLSYSTGDAGAGRNPNIVASAYSNSVAGASATTLYGIDSARDALVIQSPPNEGGLQTVGALGVDAFGIAGFDIASAGAGANITNVAFAALTDRTAGPANNPRFYTINLATGRATLVGRIGAGNRIVKSIAVTVPQQLVYGVTAGNALVTFNSATPGVIRSTVQLTGLPAGGNIVAIDFRPATGQLYGLDANDRVFIINPATGAVTPAATPELTGDGFGFDFNPVPDRLRITSDADINLRVNPENGATIVDMPLAYAAGDPGDGQNPNVVASAYTNNFPGTQQTRLFGIDSLRNTLVRQSPPNDGTLTTVGPLGISIDSGADLVGFDISSGGTALVSAQLANETVTRLFRVNLATGAATAVGQVGGTALLRGIAIAPPVVQFAAATTVVREDQGLAFIVLTRTGDTSGTVAVDFTVGGGATDSANSGSDFAGFVGRARFAPGETTRSFAVRLTNDTTAENPESLTVTLMQPRGGGGATLGARQTTTLSIVDDDRTTAAKADAALFDSLAADWAAVATRRKR